MDVIIEFLSSALEALIGFVGDWFIGIALLTVIIKALFLPLSIKQHRGILLSQNLSKAKMILDSKYKNKKDKANAKLVEIMGKYKINPLSSLLVMVAQLPVFFSLYLAIGHLGATAGSAIIPWVLGAGATDNLHVLPIAAGVAIGVQGFFGPSSTQSRNIILLALPIGIGLWFLWGAPAGLSVYWAFSALFSLVEKAIFSLSAIRERYLNVPTPEKMVKSVA